MSGTYIRGKVTREVKIKRVDTKLIGTIDGELINPFTSPLTALAYWYINYINENKEKSISNTAQNNSLEPFNKLQITIMYDAHNDKVNLTFYQPETKSFCDESHLFIYSFSQIIQHFDTITSKLNSKMVNILMKQFFMNLSLLKWICFYQTILYYL